MADSTLALIGAALSQEYRPNIVRTANRRSVLLKTLKVIEGKGKNEAWDVEGTGAYAETYSEGADVSTTGSDSVTPATLNFGRYRANFKITGDAMDAASSSQSPADLLRPAMRNAENSITKLASLLNVDLYSGAGSNAVYGLDYALRDDNTYATIDRTDSANAGFRGNLIDPGSSTDISLDQIRRDFGDTIYTACGETPDLAICKPNVWYALASKFDSSRRYEQELTVDFSNGRRVTFEGGVGAITIDGCTFVKDKDCTASEIIYINTQHVEVVVRKQTPDSMLPGAQDMEDMQLNDGEGTMPYGLKVFELARNGDSRRVTMQVKPALVVRKPNTCGIRKNVKSVS